MEKQPKCFLLLSLREMALRRMAVILWSGSDILASVSQFHFFEQPNCEKARQKNIEKIKERITELGLPQSLTKQMSEVVQPISLEIKGWKHFHEGLFSGFKKKVGLPNAAKLCWTTAGSIDYQKTAEELVRCHALDVAHRYEIACVHCLEDSVRLLWEELSDARKIQFYLQNRLGEGLPFIWESILNGEFSNPDGLWRTSNRNLTFNQYAFEYSAKSKNKTAARYFFQKLTHKEKEASLMRTANAVLANRNYKHIEKSADVLFYLLSLMTPAQQMDMLKARPTDFLLSFLHWPRQDLFMENAGIFWTHLPPSGYADLLHKMVDRVRGHYFPKLFADFFMQSPIDKECFVEQDFFLACTFFFVFIEFEDSELLKVVFKFLDSADRVKLAFHPHVLRRLHLCFSNDRWHLVRAFLREAALSDEDGERLKEALVVRSSETGRTEIENRRWKRFLEFLGEANASAAGGRRTRKRKIENCCAE